ncbi:MAG: hypothetical protein ACJART_000624 [Maribacter sp.]|jgi:hypothetical protein|tara:strand:- start:185 stop:865 length:681 start_codon:yes stop_codon:yes gene_type:complete
MSLEKKLKYLITNLNRPLLFFIPKSIIPLNEIKAFTPTEQDAIFNKIVFYDEEGRLAETSTDINYSELLIKPSLFDNNILQLIDEQTLLNSAQFSILLEKYSVHIRFFVFIANWMFENLPDYLNINSNQKSYFELQKDIFKYHKQEIENRFNIKISEEINSFEILTYLKKEKETPIKDFLTNSPTKFYNPKSIQKLKTEKQILITDEEAKSFLLHTVFHLKQEDSN